MDPSVAERRRIGRAWMAVGLVLTAAGWASESEGWMWTLVLCGFGAAAWGIRRIRQSGRERT
jgi:hypothetical protein